MPTDLSDATDFADGRPLRVLMIEDSEDDALLIRRELERTGVAAAFHCVQDADGLRAALDGAEWDVVLSDHSMPGFGSAEALAILRARNPDTPLIIVSGAIGEEAAVAALKAGANDCVRKDSLGRLAPAIDRERRTVRARAAERAAVESLRRSEARHRAVLGTTSEWVWSCDAAGVLVESSGPIDEMLGYSADELIGARLVDLIDDEDGRVRMAARMDARSDARRVVARFRTVDGTARILECSLVPIADGGAYNGFWGASRDVTAEIEAREDAERQAARAHALADAVSLMVTHIGDADALARLAARHATEMLGDGCLIMTPGDDPATLRAIALDHRDPDTREHLRTTVMTLPPSTTHGISAQVMRDGRAVLLSPLPDAQRDHLDAAGYRDFRIRRGISDIIAVPLQFANDVGGVLALIRNHGPRYTAADMGIAQELAHHVAAALQTARLVAALKETDIQRRTLLRHLVRAQEEERRRVAADIHDDSIQVMSAVAFRLDVLEDALTETREREILNTLRDEVREGIRRLRRLLVELRPPALDHLGLSPAIGQYLDRMAGESGITAALSSGLRTEPPPEVRIVAYRIAQEALTNVRKHAGASNVRVEITSEDGGLRLTVTDDGIGCPPGGFDEKTGHFGLSTMRERAEVAGGRFQIRCAQGSGTIVECWLPATAPERIGG